MKIQLNLSKWTMIILIFVASFLSISCSQDSSEEDSTFSSTTPGGGTNTPADNLAGFYVRATYNVAYPYTTHKGTGALGGGGDDWTADCAIQTTDVTKDISCIVEAQELDLWFNGLEVEFNVPDDMCDYFTYYAPYYYNLLPGTGPTRVVINDDTSTHEGTPAGQISVGGVIKSTPYCDYDYSNEANPSSPSSGGGPNCCSGTYTIATYAAGGALTTSQGSWGGKPGNCLVGPAMEVNPILSSGYPARTIIRTGSSGTRNTYTVSAPSSFAISNNFYTSNFFNAADHGGSTPLAFRVIPGVGPATNPYHEFTCYNRTEEVQARILLMVREWNTADQFANKVNGNPDVVGNETGYGNPPNNDSMDFKDLGNAYPQETINQSGN